MNYAVLIALVAFLVGFPLFFILYIVEFRRRRALTRRFAGVVDAEARVQEIRLEQDAAAGAAETKLRQIKNEEALVLKNIESTRDTYAQKRTMLNQLERQIAVYDEKLSLAELGVYAPHFDFGESETYKAKILEVRARQTDMVKAERAVTCSKQWSVEGSAAKGKTMVNRQIRLTLRAFNNECEAAIANARWNNVNAMEKRIQNAAAQIDKMNASLEITISSAFLKIKLDELYLTHEQREAQKRERDERAEAARLAREEARLLRDLDAAESKEAKYEEMLLKARREVAAASQEDSARLQARVAALEADLTAAHAASERARALAEMTKTGYVYIISNIGSFGDDVVKIGLTRRLDPEDRVRELGDASVPFLFDTHAIIYSEEAPALEAALHAAFHGRRINAANMRKEFFRVSLDEVEAAVARLAPTATFFRDREAQEYHETLARRRETLAAMQHQVESAMPETI